MGGTARDHDARPFGDVTRLASIVDWCEESGVENAISLLIDEAAERTGYGRPKELSERRTYALVGLVALWTGAQLADEWPEALQNRRPAPPPAARMSEAIAAARVLVERILVFDAELRLIWDAAPDGGAALRAHVDRLRRALA